MVKLTVVRQAIVAVTRVLFCVFYVYFHLNDFELEQCPGCAKLTFIFNYNHVMFDSLFNIVQFHH